MSTLTVSPSQAANARIEKAFATSGCDWTKIFSARYQRGNFAYRYHFVYPALALFAKIRADPKIATQLRPTLDHMYQGLIDERCWQFWHDELNEQTGAIAERNLTYAGRLALFVGLYIDAYKEPPANLIEVDGERVTYSELSVRLAKQMAESPSCGVSCYNRESMVMCNAALSMNNLIHDRLNNTNLAASNNAWLETVKSNLLAEPGQGSLFYYVTQPDSPLANTDKRSLGMDAWGLGLMASVAPNETRGWFETWRHHIRSDGNFAWVDAAEIEEKGELSSIEFATAWTYCLAAELGEDKLKEQLGAFLGPHAVTGFRVDPYISGLYLLGSAVQPGDLNRLVTTNA
jgi:hypothetical protein